MEGNLSVLILGSVLNGFGSGFKDPVYGRYLGV